LAQVQKIRDLLDNFVSDVASEELREKVRKLIPVFHSLRDLGSGLMPELAAEAGRDRILAYLRRYPRTLIAGDELLVVSGIGEWARRVRELRVEFGWQIYTGVTIQEIAEEQDTVEEIESVLGVGRKDIRPDHYILLREDQDKEAAHRWNQINEIRKLKISVKSKILQYLTLNVGSSVTGEELRYLAKNKKEWARRTRELRTEDGWAIATRQQGRPELNIGEYVLDTLIQAPEHDRKIPDAVRAEVLQRDRFRCTFCGWNRSLLTPEDPRKFLEVHHIERHVDGGANVSANLIVLCNVHHDEVHSGAILWKEGAWLELRSGRIVEV
jgi:hypothetical protein